MVVGGSEGVSMAFIAGGGVEDREFASLVSSVCGTTSFSFSNSSSTPTSFSDIFSGASLAGEGVGSGAGTGSAENES